MEKAEYVYTQILKAYLDSYIIRNKYGKFLLSQKRLKNAEQQFKIGQKITPEYQETLSNLGNLYFLTDGFDKAILNYHKVLNINANQKLILFNLGKLYLKITEYHKSVNAFKKAIFLDPENESTLRNLSIIYCHQDNMLMSVETYKKC